MEEFISLVKTLPFIYDNDHIDFKNREKRQQVWNEIAEKMGSETGNFWRFKWNCLKENYCKFKKVNADPSNQIYKKYRNWPWAENMRFLDDFPNRMSRRSILNISQIKKDLPGDEVSVTNHLLGPAHSAAHTTNICRVKPAVADELSEYLEISKDEIEPGQNQVFFIDKAFSTADDLDEPIEDIQVIIQGEEEDDHQDRKKKVKSDYAEYLRMKKHKTNNFDEVEHLFMSYAKTFKRLPPKLQRVLKLEMVTLFARYELQAEAMDADTKYRSTARK